MSRLTSTKWSTWTHVSVVLFVLFLVVGQHSMASPSPEENQIFNLTEIPPDGKLVVTETRSLDPKTMTNHCTIKIVSNATTLHTLEFTIDSSSGAYLPTNAAKEGDYVHSWGTPAGVAALKATLEETLVLTSADSDFSEFRSKYVLEDETLTGIASEKEVYLALKAGNFSELSIPDSAYFDAVTVIEVKEADQQLGGASVLLFWQGGRIAGVRGARSYGHGPFWDFCCDFYRLICPGCPASAYQNCKNGVSNPCHAFDHCCIWPHFFSWLVHLFY